ncbi:helix-turn-helix domain-containing protein [Thiothrix nivea]|uniref:Helix-turn-helix domain-containing protein n=1 Tax=Thiothrix nivea (strain ATCC 35100 / DSM 5205 / JP2) TaxID=870187 RepID=A0A656HHL5_THINJ|nr:hypothetical protein Thini_1949 [Thiothrix nivea DSM 5205]
MQSNQTLEQLLTPAQFAEKFNVSERFLQNDRVTKRRIPYIKVGRFVRYRASDGAEFVTANRIGG